MIYISYQILLRRSRKMRWGGACGMYGGEVHTGFWWGNLRERGHFNSLSIHGRLI
jgi:hypothetical protein